MAHISWGKVRATWLGFRMRQSLVGGNRELCQLKQYVLCNNYQKDMEST